MVYTRAYPERPDFSGWDAFDDARDQALDQARVGAPASSPHPSDAFPVEGSGFVSRIQGSAP